jgi:hypothetical protein
MNALKLAALDAEDLQVIAACVQDAVGKVGDVEWFPREKRLVVQLNRFVWEKANRATKSFERRRSILHFARVESVQSHKIRREASDAVLSLLTIRFEETETPAGIIYLEFAGGGSLKLTVECIEAGLLDTGAAWATDHLPVHQE